ncbi:MAG: M14 family zinc carboxypeptidase [Planctomycetia bacterium]|nr:M14 family zinc carboxypeptidase [Planctomycetia bacterium]
MSRIITAAGFVFCLLLSGFLYGNSGSSLRIDTDFPGGNIIVDSVKDDVVSLHRDMRDSEKDWFYWAFRVRGAENRKIRFVFTQSPSVGARGPAVSKDGAKTWNWLSDKPDFPASAFEYTFSAADKEVIFAFGMVYTQSTLERFLKENQEKFQIRKSVLCKSRKGREVELLRFGTAENPNKLGILMTCRHHACEMMANYTIEGVIEEIFSGSEEGNWLLHNVDFFCVPFVDKDGVEDGDQGKQRKPHDHNRDYSDRIYPEIRAITDQVSKWSGGKRTMYCDFHCPWKRDGINEILYYPGPKEPYMSAQLKKFAAILEQKQAGGMIPYKESFNLPFGKSWNIGTGSDIPKSLREWSARQKNAIFGATIEIPYANASGKPVTAESARELGHNIAKSMYLFLNEEIKNPTVNPVGDHAVNDPDPYQTPFNPAGKYLNISGVYPHLTAYNQPPEKKGDINHGEAGIGALVPWAGKLRYLTYPQHAPKGSNDKLYSVDDQLHLTIEKKSKGGTHANRLIHKESKQLFIGCYAIDEKGNIRCFDLQKLVGRLTSTMRHLFDPENKIYFYDMEGAIYEADVHTLDVNLLFKKPFPGWHGKGAYTGQDRVVFGNNGGTVGQPLSPHLLVGGAQNGPEDAGILAQWDGKKKFEILLQRQFTDITGPGGIYGANSMDDPIWAMGWDKRSVILRLLDNRTWYSFRIPKSSYTFDPKHGWFTEWPRIRETFPNQLMMCMHAGLFEFPKSFSWKNTAGIRPITTHLRYIPDFCAWKDKIVLASDEASMQENPMCGQAQSNLWFGTMDDLRRFGPKLGWGGLWMDDPVKAGDPSCGFLFAGYRWRTLHLKGNAGDQFEIQIDRSGDHQWASLKTLSIGKEGYTAFQFDEKENGEWIRIVPKQDGIASAFMICRTPRSDKAGESKIFDSLADLSDSNGFDSIFRPAAHNRSLQWIQKKEYTDRGKYIEIDLKKDASGFDFRSDVEDRSAEVRKLCGRGKSDFILEKSSVLVIDANNNRYRLPRGSKLLDSLSLRSIREVESERYLAQFHGTFYEIPRMGIKAIPDFRRIKPIASHSKRIGDFCTWRGLLVLGGTKKNAVPDGHYFADSKGNGLWFGQIDDLWKLGSPRGEGAPWDHAKIEASTPSDPYLMLGYDRKEIVFSHDSKDPVQFTIEVDFDLTGFSKYKTITVPSGKKISFLFPEGYQAHWLRISADRSCTATAWCIWGDSAQTQKKGPLFSKFRENGMRGIDEIVFVVRQPGTDVHWFANFGYFASDETARPYPHRTGAKLCILNLNTSEVRTILETKTGSIRDPQIHYDGKKMIFAYYPDGEGTYHLYTINLDGSDLRQLTFGEYDDFEPAWLPNGDIVFNSGRARRWTPCGWLPVASLFRCRADGSGVYPLSCNVEHDNTPWMLPNGQILYMRWEYVDRSQLNYHHLWTMNPDGTRQQIFFGNQNPGNVMLDAKPIPESDKVVAVFSLMHGTRDHRGVITVVSPKTGPDDLQSAVPISKSKWTHTDPWAFSEEEFMAAAKESIILLDKTGKEEILYKLTDEIASANFCVHEPRPAQKSSREPIIPDGTDLKADSGTLLLTDIYQGQQMKEVKRGSIKELLVLELLPVPIHYQGTQDQITYGGTYILERILGTVPISPEGSAWMKLPAMRSVFFVAYDHQGRPVKRMHSFTSVMPGESTTCIGCHEARTESPRNSYPDRLLKITRSGPIVPTPIPDIPDLFDFPRDIQPILDRHCVECHQYTRKDGGIDLSGDWSIYGTMSYQALSRREMLGDNRNRAESNFKPYEIGSCTSTLYSLIEKGHYNVRLSDHEMKMMKYWLDSGAVYAGTYAASGNGIRWRDVERTVQNDLDWPESKAMRAVIQNRCNVCHQKEGSNLPELPEILSGNPVLKPKIDRSTYTNVHFTLNIYPTDQYFNLSHPEKSLILTAPLAKSAGGLQKCVDANGSPVFSGSDDQGYQILMKAIQRGIDFLHSEQPRFSLPGPIIPCRQYAREMVRFGVLPKNYDFKTPIDVYQTDRKYWKLFNWKKPVLH